MPPFFALISSRLWLKLLKPPLKYIHAIPPMSAIVRISHDCIDVILASRRIAPPATDIPMDAPVGMTIRNGTVTPPIFAAIEIIPNANSPMPTHVMIAVDCIPAWSMTCPDPVFVPVDGVDMAAGVMDPPGCTTLARIFD